LIALLISQSGGCVTVKCSNEQPANQDSADYVPDQLLILFKSGTDQVRADAIHEALHTQVIRKMLSGRLHLIRIPKGLSLEDLRKAYSSFPEVEAVNLNYRIEPD
jgi:hypothetical protein